MRHGGYVFVEDGVDVKQLWLRRGDGLQHSPYLSAANGEYKLLDVQKAISDPQTINNNQRLSIRFPMPDEGFYNAYFVERLVSHGILAVNTAKAEVLKHNCREGHKYDRKLVNPNNWSNAPLDIVRLRLPEEDFHTRIQSGTVVKFQVLHNGEPASGVKVTLETKQGWIKSVYSNDEGVASFQIIQDNFSDLEKAKEGASISEQGKKSGHSAEMGQSAHARDNIEKPAKKPQTGYGGRARVSDSYLVTAEYTTDEAGVLDNLAYGQGQYTVSMTGRYYPNQFANKSSPMALLYTSAGMLVMGVGAYSYRRRRVKPFKEETFDEH